MKAIFFAALALLALPCAAPAQTIINPGYVQGNARLSTMPVATPAPAASITSRSSSGFLLGFTGTSTVAGYFLVFDLAYAPPDGAVAPIDCIPYPTAGSPFGADYSGAPLHMMNGITIAFSTTGCFTKTASATAFISVKALS